ncbi:hypothetical protein EVAR_95757_1 [Eumeta japonica]|uniref:Uncharacterized protein n=1 Tax=Eumeta variegata TaxID=151549 RepID=A0A4C1UKJ3_EUMVA|nr:hypothetical protein EVAR_95757_1 [Eumeta japonica]
MFVSDKAVPGRAGAARRSGRPYRRSREPARRPRRAAPAGRFCIRYAYAHADLHLSAHPTRGIGASRACSVQYAAGNDPLRTCFELTIVRLFTVALHQTGDRWPQSSPGPRVEGARVLVQVRSPSGYKRGICFQSPRRELCAVRASRRRAGGRPSPRRRARRRPLFSGGRGDSAKDEAKGVKRTDEYSLLG